MGGVLGGYNGWKNCLSDLKSDFNNSMGQRRRELSVHQRFPGLLSLYNLTSRYILVYWFVWPAFLNCTSSVGSKIPPT